MNLKRMVKKLVGGLESAYDWLYDDLLVKIGAFAVNMFTVTVSLWYAIMNTLPIIPQWAWFGLFLFTLLVGVSQLEGLIYFGLDDDELEEEDEEIVED